MKKAIVQGLVGIVLLFLLGASPVKDIEVKVLSFNIHHGEDIRGNSNLRAVLRIIQENNPHIVALQAVDSLVELDGRVNHQIRRLAAQTGMYCVYAKSDSLSNGSHGVGLLSKWPFEKTQNLPLPTSKGADPRMMLCGLINPIKGFTFRICNARLEYASVFDRALQSAYINQVLGGSVQPVLLAMDMGARPNEQPYFSYREDWIDAAKGSYLPTWTEGISGDRLDYLLALTNTRVRVKEYKVIRQYPEISDHYPILATFEFW